MILSKQNPYEFVLQPTMCNIIENNRNNLVFRNIQELNSLSPNAECHFRLEDENFVVKTKKHVCLFHITGSNGSKMVLALPPMAEKGIVYVRKFE